MSPQDPTDRYLIAARAPVARAAWFAVTLLLAGCDGPSVPEVAPSHLSETGLYADPVTRSLAADVLPFEPQYPLWSDGATKRRWIALPPGTSIDARDVDHWEFPVGTRLWKEFTFAEGVETRFMRRRADGSWLFATYVARSPDQDAVLAPETGVLRFSATRDGRHHDVPSAVDCRLCHESGRTPVLGFSALQLSPDRDPLAPNAVTPSPDAIDLTTLVERGLVRNLPSEHVATPPRIAGRSATERAALGYLHGNCAGCHNADGPLQRLGMRLDHPLGRPGIDAGSLPALTTTVDAPSGFTRADASRRITAGSPETSTLFLRLSADDPLGQMPPFGRHLVDRTAADLVERWIRTDLPAATPSDPPITNVAIKPSNE